MASDRGDEDAKDSGATEDRRLLERLRSDPERAWHEFLDRHAATILDHLRRLGFEGDQAMERFVYVCEKLAEDRCRRLRSVRFVGRHGEIDPWLRTVVERLSVSWAWSVAGRRRLLRPIERLGDLDQRVFALHFWSGLSPAAIEEQLRAEHRAVDLAAVLDALSRVLDVLSPTKLWRLVAARARRGTPVPLTDEASDGRPLEPAAAVADPEAALLRKEAETRLDHALAFLTSRERLAIQLRYEESLTFGDIGALLGCSVRQARTIHDRALTRLRDRLAGVDVLSVGSG